MSLSAKIARQALWGSGIGVALMVTGLLRRSMGFGSRPPAGMLVPAILAGAVMGPLVAVALMPTEALRRRGIFGHYLSWIIVCTVVGAVVGAALMVTAGDDLDTLEFATLLGSLGGLGLGAWSRGTGIGAVPTNSRADSDARPT
jgi:hypothetical protein